MMAVSHEEARRRRRYERRVSGQLLALTERKRRLLQLVGQYRLLSLPQAAALADLSPKAARNHLRELFDAGLVDVIATSRAALAEPNAPNDSRLLYGSAPGVYQLARAGLQVLQSLDLAENVHLTPERYGPKNSLHLSHELAIRDMLIFFAVSARTHAGHVLETWRMGGEAEIDLRRSEPPRTCRPDAWLIYRIDERVLVGLVEIDRGTERGSRRWLEKLTSYRVLMEGRLLKAATGYARARVLTVTPDARRRDQLAAFITGHGPGWLGERFRLADRSILQAPDIHAVGWRQPGQPRLQPLLPLPAPAAGLQGDDDG